MAPFPSPSEETAASALLLLSTEFPCLSPSKSSSPSENKPSPLSATKPSSSFRFKEDDQSFKGRSKSNNTRGSLFWNGSKSSKSCSSSLTCDDGSSEDARAHRLKFIAVVACSHELKLKVVRKSRTKTYCISNHHKTTSGKPAILTPASESVPEKTESSCSSAISSAGSGNVRHGGKRDEPRREEPKKKRIGSAHIRRRAESILKLLSHGCSSEVTIRKVIGDSPDTSKALRILLKLEEIKRSGAGGRLDPYIYTLRK